MIFKNGAATAVIFGVFGLTFVGSVAHAQATDDFTASVTTSAAVGIDCGTNLSFGRAYVAATNSEAVITLTSGGTVSSNHASVAVTGGAAGQCTISGLTGGDLTSLTIAGGGGATASGGLTGVTLSDGSPPNLIATLQVGAGGTPITGGRSGLANGAVPIHGTVTIPASHTDFGLYTATITATAALN